MMYSELLYYSNSHPPRAAMFTNWFQKHEQGELICLHIQGEGGIKNHIEHNNRDRETIITIGHPPYFSDRGKLVNKTYITNSKI